MERKIRVQKARNLRKHQTPQEKKLWAYLREVYAKRFEGLKFRRQFPIDHYIVDFCCPQKRLIIELDGSIHTKGDQPEYDAERQAYLESQGFQVLRFWNDEVDRSLESVLQKIRIALEKNPLPRDSLGNRYPLPSEGEG